MSGAGARRMLQWQQVATGSIGETVDRLCTQLPDDRESITGLLRGVTLGMLNAWFDGTDGVNGDLNEMRTRMMQAIEGLWPIAVSEAYREGGMQS